MSFLSVAIYFTIHQIKKIFEIYMVMPPNGENHEKNHKKTSSKNELHLQKLCPTFGVQFKMRIFYLF